ncbi:hypothetical protein Ple7327_0055 [Pleurocapsa sp. PCC 7327]|nr:hypothetical protein [Pleurocapsa sp. PCC 7327]AFY75544.1 hypothetical protein Ple7327_0055 [Pleurocapsa sp. PCC 7327]
MADLNGTMMQYFHWYMTDNGTLWDKAKDRAKKLADVSFTAM